MSYKGHFSLYNFLIINILQVVKNGVKWRILDTVFSDITL